MITVRRIYFYGLTLFSMAVVAWGVIGLLRTFVSSPALGESSLVATAISLILLGAPLFWFHWRVVQHEAQTDLLERGSWVRAVFLYGACTAFLGPTLFAILALLDRGLVVQFGLPESAAWFGAGQSPADNLLAILVNGIALFLCWRLLRADWRANLAENFLPEARRFYRYFWVLAGLGMAAAGAGSLLLHLLSTLEQAPERNMAVQAGEISLLVVGLPLWGYHWWVVQESLVDPAERRSLLRLVALYVLSLAGVVGVLVALGPVVNSLLRWVLERQQDLLSFLRGNVNQLGAAIPLAAISAYYGSILSREVAVFPDQPRRYSLRRMYFTVFTLLGLALALTGLYNLWDTLVRLVFLGGILPEVYDSLLRGSLSMLIVGAPLWLVAWRFLQAEADRRDDLGDKARRSVLRKSYLYLVLFSLLVGSIFFSARLLYTLLNALLSQVVPNNMGQDLAILFLRLLTAMAFLAYHLGVLRRDNRLARQTLGEMHAGFPTLVLGQGDSFGELFLEEVHRTAPRLPVAVHSVEQGAPDEAMLGAKVILIPVGLALHPPESLRRWLEEYRGRRLLIPVEREGYLLLGQGEKTSQELARDSARAVRQLAEGVTLLETFPGGPWAAPGYILGALIAIWLVGALFFLLVSALFR